MKPTSISRHKQVTSQSINTFRLGIPRRIKKKAFYLETILFDILTRNTDTPHNHSGNAVYCTFKDDSFNAIWAQTPRGVYYYNMSIWISSLQKLCKTIVYYIFNVKNLSTLQRYRITIAATCSGPT